MSSSVSNISFRYHPEDEELDDNYDTFASISTSSISVKSEGQGEESNTSASSGDVPSKVLGKLGIREETDKWKLFREVKGRIAKSVEEKFEEIKTERLKNQSKQRRPVLGQMEQSSLSDEEQSESSQVSVSDRSTKSAQEMSTNPVKSEKTDDKQESDPSGSQGSSPDRSTTPMPPTDDIDDDVDVSTKKGKGIKAVLKKKKGKTRSEKEVGFGKSLTYSALCDNETDSELVEVAQEVMEGTPEETTLAKELDRLAHPTLFQRIVRFVTEWHMILLPLTAFLLNWIFRLPQYMVGLLTGAIGLLLLQKCLDWFRSVLGSSEPPLKQLKDLLPLNTLPIFRRSIYESDIAETIFQGWMNEYKREYQPETYHITLTDSVYVRLEGSKLRLSTPRSKIPKRALWNEPRYRLLFSHERLFDIADCTIELRPEGLIHRRCWSKKYPICIVLRPLSRMGARHKEKGQETVDEDAAWVDEDKYTFDTLSEDSDDELGDDSSRKGSNMTFSEETMSADSLLLNDVENLAADSEDFVRITPSHQHHSLLYLFARTDREKEVWFRRFVAASKASASPSQSKGLAQMFKSSSNSSTDQDHPDYDTFMLQLSQRTVAQLPSMKERNTKDNEKVNTADLSISLDMMWLNAFLGRTLFDVARDPDKLIIIQEKIQKKLSTIKLPMFLEQLEVSNLELGVSVPVIQRASRPVLNAHGVWVDLDIVYEGGFKMTVDTKLNLDRIKQAQAESPSSESPKSGSPAKTVTPTATSTPQTEAQQPQYKSAVYHSEVEDSAETSSEEPDLTRLQGQEAQGSIAQPKYIRFLDKVAQSKYFQQVVDYKFIKKFVQGNNLQLLVEVKGLLGTLVLNIPPPPSDRIWYGFRTNPKLWLSAQPKFGQHAVQVISRIIEKKLCLEFQRVLVLPNMEDLIIPVMNHNIPS